LTEIDLCVRQCVPAGLALGDPSALRPLQPFERARCVRLLFAPLDVLQRALVSELLEFGLTSSANEYPQGQIGGVNLNRVRILRTLDERPQVFGFDAELRRGLWGDVEELIDPRLAAELRHGDLA